MPQQFDIDPFGLRLSKPPAFPLTLRDRLIMQALQRARRRRQGAPLPSPSLIEPLPPFGLFRGEGNLLDFKSGFKPFHFPPLFPEPSLREMMTSLLQGGGYRI